MEEREISFQSLRLFLSGFAAASATLLCHTLRHFSVVPSQPSTWYAATQHRCGWVLIATCAWFLCEAAAGIWQMRRK